MGTIKILLTIAPLSCGGNCRPAAEAFSLCQSHNFAKLFAQCFPATGVRAEACPFVIAGLRGGRL
jgi:hypothetical protein